MAIHVNALMLLILRVVEIGCGSSVSNGVPRWAGVGCTAPRCEKLHAKIQAARAEPRHDREA